MNETIPPLLQPINQLLKRNPLIHRLAAFGYHFLSESLRRIWRAFYSTAKVMRNLAYRLLRQSDYQRWANLHNYEEWWDSRTQKIARLVPPNSRVVEFGAGRRQLEKLLDSTCTYVPSDLVDRGPGTFVCDLNLRPLPDLGHLNVDTAVFGGVLEYIHDPESLVKWLAQHLSLCVASYACVPSGNGIVMHGRRLVQPRVRLGGVLRTDAC